MLHDNFAVEAQPLDYVSDPGIIARDDRMVFVNATLEIDLQGAFNSECLSGRQMRGG
jgi:itaconate CoA-transferase